MSYEIKTKVKKNLLGERLILMISRDKAHKVFVEAIKCNYDNWRVWENFLWVCLIEFKRLKYEFNFFKDKCGLWRNGRCYSSLSSFN
jgi:hypothetical protein